MTLYDGSTAKIDSIIYEKGTFQVFNFEVADYHTYFVSERNVLVHNSGPCPYVPKGAAKAVTPKNLSASKLKGLISTEIDAQSDKYIDAMQETIKRNDKWEMMDLLAEPIHTVAVKGKTYILGGHNRVKAFSGLNKDLDVIELSPDKAREMFKSKMQDIDNGLFDN